MGRVIQFLLILCITPFFCSAAQESMPIEVNNLSAKMLIAYNTSNVEVFLSQFATNPRKAAGDRSLKALFLKKAKRFHGKNYKFTFDSNLSGYRDFNYPMKTKYYPKIDNFYGVYYSYMEPDSAGRLIKYYVILKYINDDGNWYLIN